MRSVNALPVLIESREGKLDRLGNALGALIGEVATSKIAFQLTALLNILRELPAVYGSDFARLAAGVAVVFAEFVAETYVNRVAKETALSFTAVVPR